MKKWHGVVAVGMVLSTVTGGLASTSGASLRPAQSSHRHFAAPKTGYIVYWDQDEEEDYYVSSTGAQGQLVTPWDPNGQMCLLNDGTGRFVVGYDPTNPSQHNPGGPPHHAFKQPPIGEELDLRNGTYSGQSLYVPGPYKIAKSDPGEDSPPDAQGIYNGQSTYTGCAVDGAHNVFADDIGTAQGNFPIPTDGRLVEWFRNTDYKSSCILYGPDTGGVDGSHHVDGTGGLAQPGMMATIGDGNLLLPQAASSSGSPPGNVLEFDHSSFPTSASQCPGGVYPRAKLKFSVWMQGTGSLMFVPMGVAHDPTCNCYAVDSILGNPAVAWFNDQGQQLTSHATVAGETITQFGHDPSGFNPFGMAFAPDGTLYFIDIHIACGGSGFSNCSSANYGGRFMRVQFGANGAAGAPQTLANRFDFPTSVTICLPAKQVCPFPTHPTPKPTPEDRAEAGG